MRLVHEPGGIQLIFIIGGTGVGKSFLLKWLVSEIEYEWSLIQHTDLGRIPVAWMEVPAKDTKNPTWGDYYKRALVALSERHIEKKIVYDDVIIDVRQLNGKQGIHIADATIRRYRHALESCFSHRRPLIFFLDEAHQLINTGGLRVEEQVENLKSIANMTKGVHGLFGTYKMLDLLGLNNEEESDQLIRRGAIFHFRRYGNAPRERNIFNSIINSFEANMPFKKSPNLIQHADYIYKRTVGCVGILRDWLVGAHTAAVDEGATTLAYKHLKATCRISESRSIKMLHQFVHSESELEVVLDSDDDEFEEILNKTANKSPAAQTRYSEKKDERVQKQERKLPKRRRRLPGKQNPRRRQIGGDHS
jgi:hypothetical protein